MLNLTSPRRQSRRHRGFTLIETLATVGIAGVLSTIALPGFEAQLQKARRAEVLVAAMQIQSVEERFRSNAASYGSLVEIGVAPASPSGHYQLQLVEADADGYELLAVATGVQTRDVACAYMRFSAAGLNIVYASGPDEATDNPPTVNRRCWGG